MGNPQKFSGSEFVRRGWEFPTDEVMTEEEISRFEIKRELRRIHMSGTGVTPSDQDLLAEVRQDIQDGKDPERDQMARNAEAVIDIM